jgi:hypothetical protein
MRPRGLEGAEVQKDHAWGARRSPAFLREGVELRVTADRGEGNRPGALLRLINLSGHDYPTGSRRRGIRLQAGAEGAPEGGAVATLSPLRPGQLFLDSSPALSPGESRTFAVGLPAGSEDVFRRVEYIRNLAEPNGYTADVWVVHGPVGR